MSSTVETSEAATPRVLLAVDGNSLLHRAYHASARTGFRTADGRPMWAVRGLLSQLVAAVDRVCADVVVVGFDDSQVSSRRDRWPTYKAQRTPKPPTLEEQLASAAEVLTELGVAVVVPPGLEADDVLASAAAWAPTAGMRTVVATSDRDSFSLIGEHTSMLRILNGGVEASPLLDPKRLEQVTGVRPEQYADFAAFRGDPSDNLPGVPGFGAKTASRLLAALGTADAAFGDACAGGGRCAAAVGKARARGLATPEARAAFELNRAVMAQQVGVELGLLTRGRLPLAEDTVHRVFTMLQLHEGNAVRALSLKEPAPRPVPEVSWLADRAPRRFPPLPPRPAPKPAYVQEALF